MMTQSYQMNLNHYYKVIQPIIALEFIEEQIFANYFQELSLKYADY